jgi:hypothetical protein
MAGTRAEPDSEARFVRESSDPMRRLLSAGGSRRNPLFHVLVTLGVSAGLEACGGISSTRSEAGAGAGGMSATPTCPSSCVHPSAFVCDDSANSAGCRCDETRPQRTNDCPDEFQFRCSADTPSGCTGTARTGCYCDETVLTPSDCKATGQFVCEGYYPEPASCFCDPTRPTSAADCTEQAPYYYCRRTQPDVDCKCVTAIPIK